MKTLKMSLSLILDSIFDEERLKHLTPRLSCWQKMKVNISSFDRRIFRGKHQSGGSAHS